MQTSELPFSVLRRKLLDLRWPDVLTVRRQLDERGLLAAESFDHLLRKAPA
jgi:hypothetical protein